MISDWSAIQPTHVCVPVKIEEKQIKFKEIGSRQMSNEISKPDDSNASAWQLSPETHVFRCVQISISLTWCPLVFLVNFTMTSGIKYEQ